MRDLRTMVEERRSRSTLPLGGGGGGKGRGGDRGAEAAPASGRGGGSPIADILVDAAAFVASSGGSSFDLGAPSPAAGGWSGDAAAMRRLGDAESGLGDARAEISRLRADLDAARLDIDELLRGGAGRGGGSTNGGGGSTNGGGGTTVVPPAMIDGSPPPSPPLGEEIADDVVVPPPGGGGGTAGAAKAEGWGGGGAEDVEAGDDDDIIPAGTLPPYWSDSLLSSLSYDDVDWSDADAAASGVAMAPPYINDDECLVPGEPVVRVERAPQNSRRIFAGVDIPDASVDDVWKLLTDYPNLQRVVPNLVVNEVLELLFPDEDGGDGDGEVGGGGASDGDDDDDDDDGDDAAARCRTLASRMNGAILRQVGGAKVAGINFSARTTLEVREWPRGMPDFSSSSSSALPRPEGGVEGAVVGGGSKSRAMSRMRESAGRELARYVFPRPFVLSSLPHRDISMQSVPDDDGEFRMYQGVWRMQPLPGCSPPGGKAMRLTYAVEVSPRPYLPVGLVEGRIARDLCANLKAIRDIFAAKAAAGAGGASSS
jgi:hypothetical protein